MGGEGGKESVEKEDAAEEEGKRGIADGVRRERLGGGAEEKEEAEGKGGKTKAGAVVIDGTAEGVEKEVVAVAIDVAAKKDETTGENKNGGAKAAEAEEDAAEAE